MSVSLDKVKRHLRITHSLEDEVIQDYIEWATDAIIVSVFDKYDTNINKDLLEEDTTFIRAVVLLATYYYENRLTINQINQYDNPYAVLSAIQTLRASRKHFEVGDST